MLFFGAGPRKDCGLYLHELSSPSFQSFNQWSKQIVDGQSLQLNPTVSLHMYKDAFIHATLSKERRLGEDVFVLSLTVLEYT